MDEFTCQHCGAPLKSKLNYCEYCGYEYRRISIQRIFEDNSEEEILNYFKIYNGYHTVKELRDYLNFCSQKVVSRLNSLENKNKIKHIVLKGVKWYYFNENYK